MLSDYLSLKMCCYSRAIDCVFKIQRVFLKYQMDSKEVDRYTKKSNKNNVLIIDLIVRTYFHFIAHC